MQGPTESATEKYDPNDDAARSAKDEMAMDAEVVNGEDELGGGEVADGITINDENGQSTSRGDGADGGIGYPYAGSGR